VPPRRNRPAGCPRDRACKGPHRAQHRWHRADELFRAGSTLEFDDLLELSARFFAGEEGQEGIASFGEKRPARWVPTVD